MYCLWLNGNKVYTLQQLRSYYDAEAVELYCLGGGLARWLKDCGEQETAEKVEHIDLSQSISRQLAEIFGVVIPEKEEQEYKPAPAQSLPHPSSGSFSLPSSFLDTSLSSSFDTSSFALSNVYTSFFTTSFLTTSFTGGYEHEYEYESSSFVANSFSLYSGSFSAETAFLTGSFAFDTTSFSLGSFTSEYGSFSFEYSSFTPSSASFHLTLSSFSPKSAEAASGPAQTAPAPDQEQPPLTPQQKFELNISSCPLNRYGYGLHLI